MLFGYSKANSTPDFRTISDFRKEHLEALSGLFLEVRKLCQRAGLVKLGHVSLHGTRMKANTSKHKAMSYGRMKQEEGRLEVEVGSYYARHKRLTKRRITVVGEANVVMSCSRSWHSEKAG